MSLMKASVFGLVCCLMVLQQAQGQVIGLGACPDVTLVQDFKASDFLGVWYENQKYFALFELTGKCISANYSATTDASVVNVVNKQYSTLLGQVSTIEGTATLVSTTGEGKFEVEFSTTPFPAPYWVIGTDYDNYAVIFSCSDLGSLVHGRFVWILTRERSPSDEVLEAAYKVMDDNSLSKDDLQVTDQSDCPSDT